MRILPVMYGYSQKNNQQNDLIRQNKVSFGLNVPNVSMGHNELPYLPRLILKETNEEQVLKYLRILGSLKKRPDGVSAILLSKSKSAKVLVLHSDESNIGNRTVNFLSDGSRKSQENLLKRVFDFLSEEQAPGDYREFVRKLPKLSIVET